MNIYLDTEFTGLHQHTTLISIGIVASNNRTFYAEFTDYAESQVNDWIFDNVIKNLNLPPLREHERGAIFEQGPPIHYRVKGDRRFVTGVLHSWLESFGEELVVWADCLAYDWVLLCELFGGALNKPSCIYYIPNDLSTYLLAKGFPPDTSRIEFCGVDAVRHNSLDDARTVKRCVERLDTL